MPITEVEIEKEDIEKIDFDELIKSSRSNTCHEYTYIFSEKAQEAKENKDNKTFAIFYLVGAITTFIFELDSPNQPFKPWFEFHDSRGFILDDLSDGDLKILNDLVPQIKDPELLSRIADIIWVRLRNIQMAMIASTAYIDSARNLDHPNNWSQSAERIERSLQIVKFLGSKSQYYERVIDHIETMLNKYQAQDPLYLSIKLMQFLLEFKKGDPKIYIALSEKGATKAEVELDWARVREYRNLQAGWHALSKNKVEENKSKKLTAESYVIEANNFLSQNPPGYLGASHCIDQALIIYKGVPSTTIRKKELQQLLLKYQKKAVDNLRPISVEINVTDRANRAREMIRGKSKQDALIQLAAILKTSRVSELEERVNEQANNYPFRFLVTVTTFNDNGRVVARRPPLITNNKEDAKAALIAEMYQLNTIDQAEQALAIINESRKQILLEHYIRVEDFSFFLRNNIFIPRDREKIFAEGLYKGLMGDFMTSSHLLIPQIESSIRSILNRIGVMTTIIDSYGIQKEEDLGTLLWKPELEKILSKDIIFELQGLLTQAHGANFRNRMAHGFLNYEQLLSANSIYLWWFIFHLCYLFQIASLKGQNEAQEEP